MKEIATKDEKPALRIIVMMHTIATLLMKSNFSILFIVIRQNISAPHIDKNFIIEIGLTLNLLKINVPKLLKITVDRFAASPIISISVYEKIGIIFSWDEGSFLVPKITPKRAPTVQLTPKRAPQQISWIQKTGNFWKSFKIFIELMSYVIWFGYFNLYPFYYCSLALRISFFNTIIKIIVAIKLKIPKIEIYQLKMVICVNFF